MPVGSSESALGDLQVNRPLEYGVTEAVARGAQIAQEGLGRGLGSHGRLSPRSEV